MILSIYDPYADANTTVWQNQAAAHAKNAEDSAAIAALKAIAADASEKAASISAEEAKIAAQNAEKSASSAAQSADISTNTVQIVTQAADRAETAATNAQTSQAAAAGHATTASNKAQEAANSASAAGQSASSAAQSAATAEEMVEQAHEITRKMLGYFETPSALQNAYPTADAGYWAIVGSTDTLWVWDTETESWVDTHQKTDLSDYYTKSQTEEKIAAGESASAKKLSIARSIQTDLGSASSANFDGSANITPGVTGTLPIQNGGTGKNTGVDAANSLLNSLTTGEGTPEDSNYYISQNIDGSNTFHRRPLSALWNWIKSKADSLYLPKSASAASAASASKLSIARNINDTAFDGSADIRTKNSWNIKARHPNSYTTFASLTAGGNTSNCGTFILSGFDDYGGAYQGAWLVQIGNRSGSKAMRVVALIPGTNNDPVFGHYTSNNVDYFAVKASDYPGGCAITVLDANGGITYGDLANSTTAPSGWTAVTPVTIQTSAYTLPLATNSARGGVKIGYTQNGKNYPVQLSEEQMYVNVPWTDTNTTYTAATNVPLAPGTAAVGASAKYAREDHVHPVQTSVASATYADSAASATKLSTARKINDTAFDGSADVRTATSYNYIIPTNASSSGRYISLARMGASSYATLLISLGTGDYSACSGLWALSYANRNAFRIQLTCIASSLYNTTTPLFGHATTSDGSRYLCLWVPAWSAFNATVTQLSNDCSSFEWNPGTYSTTAPPNWTIISSRALQTVDDSMPKAGGTFTGKVFSSNNSWEIRGGIVETSAWVPVTTGDLIFIRK